MKDFLLRVVLPLAFLVAVAFLAFELEQIGETERQNLEPFERHRLDRLRPPSAPKAPGAYPDPFDDPGPDGPAQQKTPPPRM